MGPDQGRQHSHSRPRRRWRRRQRPHLGPRPPLWPVLAGARRQHTSPSASEGNVGATAGRPQCRRHTECAYYSRTWTWRAIDTSWAQPHSIFLADLDGDKKPELVAGKRYMGHEGKDPGEYDLLCAYSYKFDPNVENLVAKRNLFQPPRRLRPRSAGGRYRWRWRYRSSSRQIAAAWCLLERSRGPCIQSPVSKARCRRRQLASIASKPFSGYDASTRERPIAAIAEGRADSQTPRRLPNTPCAETTSRSGHADGVMGPLPAPSRRVPLDVKIEKREETPDYVRIKLTYAAEPGDRVPALLLVPKKVTLDETGLTVCSRPIAERRSRPTAAALAAACRRCSASIRRIPTARPKPPASSARHAALRRTTRRTRLRLPDSRLSELRRLQGLRLPSKTASRASPRSAALRKRLHESHLEQHPRRRSARIARLRRYRQHRRHRPFARRPQRPVHRRL